MSVYVGLTDRNWFEQLRRESHEDINFWKPGGETTFRVLKQNELFLFKLKSPINYIVGGGFFTNFSFLPISLAWDAFGRANGVPDLPAFAERVSHFRRKDFTVFDDPTVGCVVLSEPFFLEEHDWIPAPADWKPNIVQGKSYGSDSEFGSEVFVRVAERLRGTPVSLHSPGISEAYVQQLTNVRIGQGAFRILVTEAYERRCAITGERTLPALEAAHIQPYSEARTHEVSNGLLLRADLHLLFDRGLITITPEYQVRVSPAIRDRFDNGRDYYALENKQLKVWPKIERDQPSESKLLWHNKNKFIA